MSRATDSRAEGQRPVLRVQSWSGGADSTACIIYDHLKNGNDDAKRIGLIVFSEVLFDRNYFGQGLGVSAEHPAQLRFIASTKEVFESWGYRVAIISHPERDYMWHFNHIIQRSRENQGYAAGHVLPGKCAVQRDAKISAINKFLKELGRDYELHQSIGYTADETERLRRMRANNEARRGNYCYAPLAEAGITHSDAIALCEQYGLLSPIYKYVDPSQPDRKIRSGCFFCPWAKVAEQAAFKMETCYGAEVWEKFIALEQRTDIAYKNWNFKTHETLSERNAKVIQFIEDYY